MSKYKQIIAIDPSGNFDNGKGGTGIAVVYTGTKIQSKDNYGRGNLINDKTIWAKDVDSKKKYYTNIIDSIANLIKNSLYTRDQIFVVIEDFRLQKNKAGAQANQTMETSELIAIIETKLDDMGVTHTRQQNTIKSRWKDALVMKEIKDEFSTLPFWKPDSRHSKDALRHLLHAYFFTQNKIKID